ncbi:glutamine synthetase family protein [Patescibacteria group bacterium]|nr:glutamine synthetase family protein [Patescibacteria group bacterium]
MNKIKKIIDVKNTEKSDKETNSQKEFSTLIVAAPDMVGRLIGRRMPFKEVAKKAKLEVGVCSSVLAWDTEQLPIDGLSIAGFHTGWQDMQIVSEISSVRPVSWHNQAAIAIGDIYDKTGEIVPVAPRSILREQVKRLADIGLTATVATELEFYLTPNSKTTQQTVDKRHDYAIDGATDRMETFFDELRSNLASSNILVESWQSEWGLGQWEVNLTHGNPIDVADSHILFKLAVKELAIKYGYRANFMAKPKSSQVGSSGHIHISLRDKSGHSVFFDHSMPHNVSKSCLYAIEGILHYTPECMPLYAGNINSYRRLAAGEFCGHGPSWGFDNRTVTCRVMTGDEESTHLEFRIPGADINPYLAIAGVLASVRKGISDRRQPNQKVVGDANTETSQQYPLTLESATESFIHSSYSKSEFGAEFVSHLGSHLKHECKQFSGAVTDWELKRYADV